MSCLCRQHLARQPPKLFCLLRYFLLAKSMAASHVYLKRKQPHNALHYGHTIFFKIVFTCCFVLNQCEIIHFLWFSHELWYLSCFLVPNHTWSAGKICVMYLSVLNEWAYSRSVGIWEVFWGYIISVGLPMRLGSYLRRPLHT